VNDAQHDKPRLDLGKPTWVRYQVLGAVCVLAVIVYMHRVGFAKALPNIRETLGLDRVQGGWLAAMFLVAYGAFEVPWGMLVDRTGARHSLTILVLASSLATGATSLVLWWPESLGPMLPFISLLALRFLFGLFQAGAFPILSRVLADWMPTQERAFSQGCIWMCTRLGGLIIPGILTWLIILYGGKWQTPLWIVSGLGLLWCMLFWPWFRNRPEEMPKVNQAERDFIVHGRAPQAEHHAVPWRLLLHSRSVWCLCLMYGCAGFAGNFYVTLLHDYLKTYRNLPEEDVDLLAGLPFLCGAVACIGSGLLSDWLIRRLGNRRWGRSLNGTVGMFMAAVAWLTLDHVEATWALAVVLSFIFFCNDMVMGPAWASCADIGERHAGTLGGAMNMLGSVLGAGGAILASELLERGHSGVLFAVFAAAYLTGSMCWLGVDVTHTLAAQKNVTEGHLAAEDR